MVIRKRHADIPTLSSLTAQKPVLLYNSPKRRSGWTCFSIWQRALSCPSPRTDPETSSGWPSTLGYRHLLYRSTKEHVFLSNGSYIRCRFPSSRRFSVGVCLVFHGLKSPRLFNFPSFRRRLYADIINRRLESPRLFMFASSRRLFDYPYFWRWGRLKDAMPERANSRGFLNPWYSSVSHTSAVCKDGCELCVS